MKLQNGKKEISMTKSKLNRMVAALLTMAMVFSLLAMPASAAAWALEVNNVPIGENGETVTVVIANQSIPLLIDTIKENAGDQLEQVSGLLDFAGEVASGSVGKMVFSMSSSLVDKVNEQLGGDTMIKMYEGTVYENVYIGIIGSASNTPKWYSEAQAKQVINAITAGGSTIKANANGELVLNGEVIPALDESQLVVKDNTLLYVGVAVAAVGAATAIYFHRHPEAWEKVTTTVQDTWNKITGKAPAEETPAEQTPAETEETAETEEAAQTEESAQTAQDSQAQQASAGAEKAQSAETEDAPVVVKLAA
jgi:hypothetical protein